MKLNEIKRGMILWDAFEENKDKVFIVLSADSNSAKIAKYDPVIKEIRREQIFYYEWKSKQYETSLSTKQKFKMDSKHSQKLLKELFNYSDQIFGRM